MNLFSRLKALLPDAPLQVGQVTSIANGVAVITMNGGAKAQARGDAQVGDRVFFRAGAIEGPAPALTLSVITL